LHSLAIGIADDDEPVQRDDGHRQGRHVDWDPLRNWEELAQDSTEKPLPGKRLNRCEGNRETAHLKVLKWVVSRHSLNKTNVLINMGFIKLKKCSLNANK
jgi:hypothetical protein